MAREKNNVWLGVFLFSCLLHLFYVPTTFAGQPASENTGGVQDRCLTALCRPPQTLSLVKKDGSPLEAEIKIPLPIIENGMVTVLAGETLYIEADPTEIELVNLRAVEKLQDPQKTIIIEFRQEKGKSPAEHFMMLKVQNPFLKPVKYHAHMLSLDGDQMQKTSSCPVKSGASTFEQWPYPIFQLILSDFSFVPETQTRCVY